MDNLGPIILAVCGLSVVCIGLLAVVAFLVFRFTGGAIFAPLMSLISGVGRDEDEADSDYIPRRPTRRQPRTTSAQSARPGVDDFDAAVERYRQQGKSGSGSSGASGGAPGLRRGGQLSGDLGQADESSSGSLRRRSRRRDEDAEIYDDDGEDGGLFDL